MTFTDAYAACPVCSPTRASILTGKYPATVGVTDWIDIHKTVHPARGKLVDAPYIDHLPLEEISLGRALKDCGYNTWHVGKWHLGEAAYSPQMHGFDVNLGGCFWGHPKNGYFSPYKIPGFEDGHEGEYLTDRLTDEAIRLIEGSDGVSILPLLKGADSLEREAIFWHYPHYGNQGGTPGSSIRAGDYKLIHFFEDDCLELYNLREDLGEDRDLREEFPEIAAKLAEQLADWREAVEAKIPQEN